MWFYFILIKCTLKIDKTKRVVNNKIFTIVYQLKFKQIVFVYVENV